MIWGRVVTLVNVRGLETLRFTSRILAVGEPPHRGDTVIDVDGAFVLPGLVNAHDHLELNHYGRQKFRDRYDNATQWIDDMRPRLAADPVIRDGRQLPLTERLFAGAMKNPFVRCHHRGASQSVLQRTAANDADSRGTALRLGALLCARTRTGRRAWRVGWTG
jgi:hypothetical protein